jgi:ribonuclease HII
MAAQTGRSQTMLEFERMWLDRGYRLIAGIDEAGRGPLAGPVVAAAVILPHGRRIPGVRDSKVVPAPKRIRVFDAIINGALDLAVGIVSAEIIDRINILEASRLASYIAVKRLRLQPEVVLTDALVLKRLPMPHMAIIHGDARCYSIAAASIVAKVVRDRLMTSYHQEYPQYGFLNNKGYKSQLHFSALERCGPSTLHRRTYRGVCWFDQVTIRSRTYEAFAERIAGCRSGMELEEIRATISLLRHYLPTIERQELNKLIAAREREQASQNEPAGQETPREAGRNASPAVPEETRL